MPGANCSIFGCNTSRRMVGLGIFKIPSGDDEFNTKWRNKLLDIVTKNRVVDSAMLERINKKRIFICELHFTENLFYISPRRTMLLPGALPTLRLPKKTSLSYILTPQNVSYIHEQQLKKQQEKNNFSKSVESDDESNDCFPCEATTNDYNDICHSVATTNDYNDICHSVTTTNDYNDSCHSVTTTNDYTNEQNIREDGNNYLSDSSLKSEDILKENDFSYKSKIDKNNDTKIITIDKNNDTKIIAIDKTNDTKIITIDKTNDTTIITIGGKNIDCFEN